jgi:hypothetical protein
MHQNQSPSEANNFYQPHVELLIQSYQRLLNRCIFDNIDVQDLGRQAFAADFALLSHNTDDDPLFNYANKTALELFELNWDELIVMPSRLSAEPMNQQARERLLADVTRKGFIDDYAGVRISKTGKRFNIQNAVVWNVIDEQGIYQGQAACFKEWFYL